MAKCGLYKYSFCTHKHDTVECANCLLVKRHGKMYKFIEGKKYKKCPHCGEYKPLNEFKTNSQSDISWCYECQKTNAREYARRKKLAEKPIVRIIEVKTNEDGPPFYNYFQLKPYNAKELKEWYEKLLNDDESGKRYIITKL